MLEMLLKSNVIDLGHFCFRECTVPHGKFIHDDAAVMIRIKFKFRIGHANDGVARTISFKSTKVIILVIRSLHNLIVINCEFLLL